MDRHRHGLPAGNRGGVRRHLHRRHLFCKTAGKQFDHGGDVPRLPRHRRVQPGGVAAAVLPVLRLRHRHRWRGHLRGLLDFPLRRDRVGRDSRHHLDHRILHRHRLPPRAQHRGSLRHRPWHQCDQGAGGVDGSHGPACPCHHRRRAHHPQPGGALWPCRLGDDDAGAGGDGGGAGCLWAGDGQRRRHRRDVRHAEGNPPDDRRAGCRGQHHQGGDERLRHRIGRPRRAGAVRRLHAGHRLLRLQPASPPLLPGHRGAEFQPVGSLRRHRPVVRRADSLPVRRAWP